MENKNENTIEKSITIDPNSSEKAMFISRILKQKRKLIPYDGMAANRKKIDVNDCLPNEKLKRKGRNKLFDEPSFPLLNILSNRNALNNSSLLMKNMLSEQNLPKSEENTITSKSYKNPIIKMKKLPFIINYNRNPLYEKEKKYLKRVNESVSIISLNKRFNKKNNSDIPLSKQLSLIYKKMKDNYKKKHLKNYLINITNQDNIKSKNEINNYVLNAYKIKRKDDFLDLIRNDTSKLKYDHKLKLYTD